MSGIIGKNSNRSSGVIATVTTIDDTSPQLGGFLDANGNYIQMEKGGDIASASPTVIDTDGDYFAVTGTTNFSAFTVAADRHFFLEFGGVLIMTHGAGTLDLPSQANITTAASDVGEFVSTASDVVTCVNYTRATGKALVASHSATVGVQTIWVPAAAMRPTSANGCAAITDVVTSANQPDMQVLDFDKDNDEHAQFQIMFPKSWNLGTIQYQVVWAGIAATTGVSWFLQGVAVSDNDSIDVAYGTAVESQDDAQGAVEEVLVSPAATVTIGGTPADNDLCFFRIYRDISDSDDDMSGDARLIGIRILFTTDAENDD